MVLQTLNGSVKGLELANDVVRFSSVPYAAPPVGELRWKAPQPPDSWEGVRDCTHFARCAFQMTGDWGIPTPYGKEFSLRSEETPSEDCLTLNIWTPLHAVEHEASLPVLCIIHGGGFEAGSGGVPVLDGANIAAQGIVVVTINYRMGVFGFLAHPELTAESPIHSSGNYGLLDQIQALRWIRENIAAFGGDPEQVTISGESAGAISVSALCEIPAAKGLFCRASLQSCTHMGRDTYCPQIGLKEAEQKGLEYSARFEGKSIDELRKLSTEELFEGTWGFFPFRDNILWPKEDYESGAASDVTMLIGSNADEGTAFRYYFEIEDHTATFVEQARLRYKEDADVFLSCFPVDDPNTASANMAAAYGEKLFSFSVWLLTEKKRQLKGNPVYYYYYSRVMPGSEYGAFHSSELPYLYRNFDKSDTAWEESDRHLCEAFSSYLLQFVKTGNPNGNGFPVWKPYAEDPALVMELGEVVQMIPHPALSRYQLYYKHESEEGVL